MAFLQFLVASVANHDETLAAPCLQCRLIRCTPPGRVRDLLRLAGWTGARPCRASAATAESRPLRDLDCLGV